MWLKEETGGRIEGGEVERGEHERDVMICLIWTHSLSVVPQNHCETRWLELGNDCACGYSTQ